MAKRRVMMRPIDIDGKLLVLFAGGESVEEKLSRDVFLALAAVGWADGKLDPDEADAIVRTALESGLEIDEIAEIENATREKIEMGEIELSSLSKSDRLFVYAVGAWIARVDDHVAPQEITALNRLADVLKIPDFPREHADTIAIAIGELSENNKPAFYNLPLLRRTLNKHLAQARNLNRD